MYSFSLLLYLVPWEGLFARAKVYIWISSGDLEQLVLSVQCGPPVTKLRLADLAERVFTF